MRLTHAHVLDEVHLVALEIQGVGFSHQTGPKHMALKKAPLSGTEPTVVLGIGKNLEAAFVIQLSAQTGHDLIVREGLAHGG